MFNIEVTILLAREAYRSGYIKEAIELYKNLLSIQPEHPIATRELKEIMI